MPAELALAATSGSTVPILAHGPGATVAYWRGQPIPRERFIAHVEHLARGLPQRRFTINLCRDRYLFLTALCAAAVREQTTLMPSAPQPRVVANLCADYPDAYALTDRPLHDLALKQHYISLPERVALNPHRSIPRVNGALEAIVLFTSGSTGRPRPSSKRWQDLMDGARLSARRFELDSRQDGSILATVPPQHMYGLEVSIALPLVTGIAVHAATPLFPESVRRTLAAAPAPRRLFTTPTHLRACTALELSWPEVDFVVSASAPLTRSLARKAEARFRAPVLEIYGCTEAGAVATRRTLDGAWWTLCEGMEAKPRGDDVYICAPHLPEPVNLCDRLEFDDQGRFELRGRQSDLIKVGGNRALLSDLTLKLNELEGVRDGVFLMPQDNRSGAESRPVAIVVAPDLDRQAILAHLADSIHPAFVPRLLYKVDRLPRNELGKLPIETLLKLVKELAGQSGGAQ